MYISKLSFLISLVYCRIQTRIINGHEPPNPFEYPWVAAVRQNGTVICGGSLIAKNKILTTAQCSNLRDPAALRVSLHRYDLILSDDDEQGGTYRVARYRPHPKFGHTLHTYYDVAVWTLMVPRKDNVLSNIKLPNLNYAKIKTPLEEEFSVIGWGMTESGKYSSKQLLSEMTIVSDEVCQSEGADLDMVTNMCANGVEERNDACFGDYGGPLVKIDNGNHTIVGITSLGKRCGGSTGARVVTRISAIREFILEHLKDDK